MRTNKSAAAPGVNGMSGNQVRIILPTVPVREASLAGLKEQMRSASQAAAQAEATRASAAAEYARRLGDKATERALREQSRQSARQSRAEVKVAKQLRDLPDTREALQKGEITLQHAKVISAAAGRVEVDERKLVEHAKVEPVDLFARTVRRHEQQRSQDDGVSRLEAQKRNRQAWIKTDPVDGMTVLYGRFDPITGARIKSVLSARTDLLWREEDPQNRATPAQRMADAVAQLLCLPATTQNGRSQNGAVLFVIANYDIVTQKLGDACLVDGTPLPIETVRDLACQAQIVPAFFDSRSQPLWVGRAKRLATRAQRMALQARDRGCIGCEADPNWCQAHHIIPWAAGGPTDIDNMCLLCSRCHHQVHDNGWQIRADSRGAYQMIPPKKTRNRPPPETRPRRRRKQLTPLRR